MLFIYAYDNKNSTTYVACETHSGGQRVLRFFKTAQTLSLPQGDP